MEQIYLLEIFVDKVYVYTSDDEPAEKKEKCLIIKIKFGPKTQFIIREAQLAVNPEKKEDVVEVDENGQKKWSRTVRVGKSYLFSSFPDTVLSTLNNFPLEIEVWNDDKEEKEIFVGVGQMSWNTEFFHFLKDTSNVCEVHEPITIKEVTPLKAECCCKLVGEVAFILRLTALGQSITTEFQQLMNDPEKFVFRTDRSKSMFQCKRVEGDDPNFVMTGSIYETTTLEDPEVQKQGRVQVEICTDLESCAKGMNTTCVHLEKPAKPPLEKIKMGDITGPCGNANCALAHKVRAYIRNLDAYKAEAGKITSSKDSQSDKICGTCSCKDDKWHRGMCPENSQNPIEYKECTGCGGKAPEGKTCKEQDRALFGTGVTPKDSKSTVNYAFIDNENSVFYKDYTIGNVILNYNNKVNNTILKPHRSLGAVNNQSGCCCQRTSIDNDQESTFYPSNMDQSQSRVHTPDSNWRNFMVYNVDTKDVNRRTSYFSCPDPSDSKDCRCNPVKPKPPCRTFNCECLAENMNIASRRSHKPYCPAYKHKIDCPVNMVKEDEVAKKEEDEDEAEPLPYGLPPIQLGPCPVLGRPCSVPDGFARMYRTAAIPPQPPSWSDAGKVCCSKEYERIKAAIKEYTKYEKKDHDMRCINKFNIDTEKRCCDTDQRLFSLVGKGCCAAHKLAIQEEYKSNPKKSP